MNIVDKASLIATTAHGAMGQKRKHSGIDYINHPQDVVHILQGEAGMKVTRRMLAAADTLHTRCCPCAGLQPD